MSIPEAARATRRYAVYEGANDDYYVWTVDGTGEEDEPPAFISATEAEAQAACDRMNLAAVLEAMREPHRELLVAAVNRDTSKEPSTYTGIWRAMIDALLAKTREASNG